MRLFIPVMFLVVAGACIPAGAQQSSSGGRTFFDDPAKAIKAEDHPLRLRLVANVAEYRLDLGRRTPQAFRDFVKKTIADAAPKKSGTDGASYNGRGNYEIPVVGQFEITKSQGL